MECELVHKYEVRKDDGGLSNTVVFGRVKRFHMVRLLPYAPSLQYSPAQLP
jgi:flavin reductase (DIM6/NTAB) family NADH-FMN oxidoreductase RutF